MHLQQTAEEFHKLLLLLIQSRTVGSNYTLRVEHQDILFACSKCNVQLCTADGSSTCTVYNNLHLFNLLAVYAKSVKQTSR